MKHFTLIDEDEIMLPRVFSVSKNIDTNYKDGCLVLIQEECDGCYDKFFTKEEAIEMFQEAIDFIKGENK